MKDCLQQCHTSVASSSRPLLDDPHMEVLVIDFCGWHLCADLEVLQNATDALWVPAGICKH